MAIVTVTKGGLIVDASVAGQKFAEGQVTIRGGSARRELSYDKP